MLCISLILLVVEIEIDAKVVLGWVIEELIVIYILFLLSWITGPLLTKFLFV